MKTLSIGKYRNLQGCSTPQNTFAILALDHRNNLRKLLNLEPGDESEYAKFVKFKIEILSALASSASGVLLDPEYSAAQSISCGVVQGQTGIIVALEKTGFTGSVVARESNLLPGWNAAKTKRMGATGAKLLVYYHPDSPTAPGIEELVKKVAAECEKAELPLFLEPLSYSLDPQKKALDPDERLEVVIETARRLSPLGADVLKSEFPIDVTSTPKISEWETACQKLSEVSVIPWVLLSASVDFETFFRMATISFVNGASGVAVGRAVWKELVELNIKERPEFLRTTAYQRMERIKAQCESLASPWTDFYSPPPVNSNWFAEY